MNRIFYLILSILAAAFVYPVVSNKADSFGTTSMKTYSEQLTGIVVRVLDGDTIDVEPDSGGEPVRIRLKGIDCPESDQFWGDVATEYLTVAIDNFPVTVDIYYRDQHKRPVGIVYYDDININRFLVEQGHCWVYRQFNDDERLLQLEKNAKESGIGLWRYENPVEPWNYRKERK